MVKEVDIVFVVGAAMGVIQAKKREHVVNMEGSMMRWFDFLVSIEGAYVLDVAADVKRICIRLIL